MHERLLPPMKHKKFNHLYLEILSFGQTQFNGIIIIQVYNVLSELKGYLCGLKLVTFQGLFITLSIKAKV